MVHGIYISTLAKPNTCYMDSIQHPHHVMLR